MNVQDRIKNRRQQLDLTLKDVAKALHVSEATVSRYESGDIQNMGIDKIANLSKVLQCSPAYLMGWYDSIIPSPAADLQLTDTERDIILEYRKVDSVGKEMVLRVLGIVEKGENQNLA